MFMFDVMRRRTWNLLNVFGQKKRKYNLSMEREREDKGLAMEGHFWHRWDQWIIGRWTPDAVGVRFIAFEIRLSLKKLAHKIWDKGSRRTR